MRVRIFDRPGHESGQGIIVDLRLNKAVLLFFTKLNVPLSGRFAEMSFAVFTLHITRAGSCTKGNGYPVLNTLMGR